MEDSLLRVQGDEGHAGQDRRARYELMGKVAAMGADEDSLDPSWHALHAKQDQRNALRHWQPHHHKFTDSEKNLMNTYESLDYEKNYSEVFKATVAENLSANARSDLISRWLIFAAIGILTGTLAFVVSSLVESMQEWKYSVAETLLGNYNESYAAFAGISIIFVFISTSLVAFYEPVAGGSGIPELKGFLNGTNYLRLLKVKTLVAKILGVLFSVSGGLIIGKEGPMVHSGAIIAANLSHNTGLRRFFGSRRWIFRFRNDRDRRDFVSGGCAAGVAAAFGAPIGGVLFALEEAASFWSISLTWMVFFCAMLSTFTLNLWKVAADPSKSFGGLISFGPPTSQPYRVWETPFFLVLGVVGGLVGALFNALNAKLSHWRRDFLASRPLGRMWYRALEAVAVSLLTATLAFWLPVIFNECAPIPQPNDEAAKHALGANGELYYIKFKCNNGTYNQMASAIFGGSEVVIKGFFHNTASVDPLMLVVYFFVIFFLACLTYGIAVPSGLFVPCILTGCAYGRLWGELLRAHVFPNSDIHAGTYALFGAVSMLGGVSRMTISLTVILLETTQNIKYVSSSPRPCHVSQLLLTTFAAATHHGSYFG